MHSSFNIVSFNEDTGSIAVRFIETNSLINIDLPLTDGKYPEGEELSLYIMQFEPNHISVRQKQLKNVSNKDYISRLVSNEVKVKSPEEKLLELRIKRTKILKESDWIFLPDSPVSSEIKQEWVNYRQKLRDITNNINDIDSVALPVMPNQPENFWVVKRKIYENY